MAERESPSQSQNSNPSASRREAERKKRKVQFAGHSPNSSNHSSSSDMDPMADTDSKCSSTVTGNIPATGTDSENAHSLRATTGDRAYCWTEHTGLSCRASESTLSQPSGVDPTVSGQGTKRSVKSKPVCVFGQTEHWERNPTSPFPKMEVRVGMAGSQ